MRVLVACADYPSENSRALQFVHVRNKYYIKAGIDVTVLNFACSNSYEFEGVNVVSLKEFEHDSKIFDILICHAPNLRNHYKFIRKESKNFKKIIFFFHGHEIVKINDAYPRPYAFKNRGVIKYMAQNAYDCLKLYVWKKYFGNEMNDCLLVFVSNSLKDDFFYYTKSRKDLLEKKCNVIYNSVGEVFEKECYNEQTEKEYDFITIRSDIDNSVYCIDLVTRIAKLNPEKKFLLIGKGEYFEHNRQPENLIHINRSLKQEDLLKYIDASYYALMPTRRDSQGVMACELATYGISLVTSDLKVCKEVFEGFENVQIFSDEEIVNVDLEKLNKNTIKQKNEKCFFKNTVAREIYLLENL